MPGVPRKLSEHSLKVNKDAKPVKHGLQRLGIEKRKAVRKEILRLTAANFIREVVETDWLANPVLVPTKNTSELRMCIYFTGLNKACPKDPFALPRIDQVIDATVGSELLCFLYVYSGYHQIKMKESGQIKTSFTTPYGNYCYVTMPFCLKSAGTTY